MVGRAALVAPFALFVAFAAVARAASLDDGLNAYRDNRATQAERAFTAIVADPRASVDDRAGAQRELGRIAWLARGDTRAVASALAQAPQSQACETAVLAARIFREAGHASAMVSEAARALPRCQGALKDDLRVELARDQLAVARGSGRDAALRAAANYLSDIQSAWARSPAASSVRLSLAIMQRDANAVLTAWCDYFWLTNSDAPRAMSAYGGHAQEIFTAGLSAHASSADRLALLTMMTRAGFIDDARRLAVETHISRAAASDVAWQRLNALFRFDTSVRAITLAANKRLMAGQRAPTYTRDILAAQTRLLSDAGLHGDADEALLQTYGLYGTIGETGGFPSLHAGFVVQDDRVHIEQYGRAGDLRFIAVDNMLANGYQAWLWDGWAETGGWAPDDATIVQVRSAYTTGPLSLLAISRPGPSRDRYLARIAQQDPGERTSLSNNNVISLTATSARLNLQAIDAMAARARGSETAFVAEAWRATLQHSIFIHEGRHVLDKATFRGSQTLGDEELEFRAKLSELALADYPRLALSNISAVNVGDGTAHGRANARILSAYRDWISAHKAEIAGYEVGAPALAQLDKLSDDQIRAVARALDPAAQQLGVSTDG